MGNIPRKRFNPRQRLMDEGAYNWMLGFIKKNFWRVSNWIDYTDLIQDGQLCYYHLLNRYPNAVDPPHIMSLFMTTFTRHLHDLANNRTQQLDDPVTALAASEEHEAAFWNKSIGNDDIAEQLAGAPDHVKKAIHALENNKRLRTPSRRKTDGTRTTLNDRLCQAVGCDSTRIDLLDEIRYYLS